MRPGFDGMSPLNLTQMDGVVAEGDTAARQQAGCPPKRPVGKRIGHLALFTRMAERTTFGKGIASSANQ